MAYCRFSSNNWKSDIYAYQDCGGYSVHVAARRHVGDIPKLPPFSSIPILEWMRAYDAHIVAVKQSECVTIGGPYDGAYFFYASIDEMIAGLREIADYGYNVPSWLYDEETYR